MFKKEVERRFLLKRGSLKNVKFTKETNIIQGYYYLKSLTGIEPLERIPSEYPFLKKEIVRIRVENMKDVYLTLKRGKGVERNEFEIKIDFNKKIYYFLKNDVKILKKVRKEFIINGFKALLDIYKERYKGVKIVEVEFKNKRDAKKFKPPKNFIEITDFTYLTNKSLYFNDEEKILKRIREIYANKN
ncbi:MAG: CYTH domain-containing protein [bacterium]|nr:CYTH domain-containing protein [bacterium]